MKRVAYDTETGAASNPRQEVENCILAGLSKEDIFRMLASVYKLEPGQCDRLYSLVEGELSNYVRHDRIAPGREPAP